MQFVHEKWILLYKKIKQACSDYKVTVMTIELFTLYAVIGGLWSDLDLEYESPITKFLFSDMNYDILSAAVYDIVNACREHIFVWE